jgi:tetratricopeptide (TPR) repeat protein
MNRPNWSEFALDQGVLLEANSDGNRLVLWHPTRRDQSFQYWARIATVARAAVTAEEGLCTTPATTIQARQRISGLVGKLLDRLRQSGSSRAFVLPDGQWVEQCGERDSDLLLVWTEEPTVVLDEALITARWPDGRRYHRLGPRIGMVALPVQAKPAGAVPEEPVPPPDASPRKYAEELLAGARASGDRSREAAALADLGIVILTEGDVRGAIPRLEEALALARQLGDATREHDVLGNLGMALLQSRQPDRARELFERGLAHARSTGDRMAEKVALERLGLTAASLGSPARALELFELALQLTRQVGDRQQEANLLWLQGIQHAELGDRESAISRAQEAVALFGKLGRPQAGWYGAYLQKYRMGLFDTWPDLSASGVTSTRSAGPEAYLGGSLVAGVVAGQSGGALQGKSTTGPGLLRMALSATKSMAQFAGSGFKMSPTEIQRQRLQTCATCEHHTGMRCKICGCFTAAKSRILHESCPIGKWPS